MSSVGNDDANQAHIYKNNDRVSRSYHNSWSQRGFDYTSGRELILDASSGDSIRFKADRMDGKFYYISLCFEFIPTTM